MTGQDDRGAGAYRRFLMVFGLVAAAVATAVGGVLIARGHGFYSFLALCVVAFLILVVHGYRQEAAEHRDRVESRQED
ncbi:MAG: hypothetical protein ACYTGZ_16170 [Planctomycetota bacterium]|jgi:hypothetical protein